MSERVGFVSGSVSGAAAAVASLVGALGGLPLGGCGTATPIALRPASPRTAATCPLPRQAIVLEGVVDRRGYDDPANVGFTQTGWNNVKSSIRITPAPTQMVGEGIARILASCVPTDGSSAPLRLQVQLTRFQTTELTGFSSEQITTEVDFEVRVLRQDGSLVTAFTARGVAAMRGVDTTKNAPTVITGAVEASLSRFALELSLVKVPPSASPPPPARLVERFAASAQLLDATSERKLFREDLGKSGIVAVVLYYGPGPSSAGPVEVRRDGVVAELLNGDQQQAIDPRKLEEQVRANPADWALAFGLVGGGVGALVGGGVAANEDQSARTNVASLAMENVGIAPGAPLRRAVLFFRGLPTAPPVRLLVELHDPASHAVETVSVPVSGVATR